MKNCKDTDVHAAEPDWRQNAEAADKRTSFAGLKIVVKRFAKLFVCCI